MADLRVHVCCPSYGRPVLAREMYESCMDTARDVSVSFYLCVTDPCHDEYDLPCLKVGGAELPLPVAANVLAASVKADMLGLVGDDVLFETKHWDDRFREAAEDGPYMIGCYDGRNHGSIPHPFIGRAMIETLGYFFPPMFHHFKGEMWLRELAESIGRLKYLDDVVMTHRKTYDDTTAKKQYVKGYQARDALIWQMTERYREIDKALLKDSL